MPKVSKYTFRINHEFHQVDIWYSSNDGFYAKIPDQFVKVSASLDGDIAKQLRIRWKRKTERDYENGDWIVHAITEVDCKEKFSSAIQFLTSKSVVKTKVILIQFKADRQSFSLPNNTDFSVSCGLCFCFATEIIIGDSKTYESEFGRQISFWSNDNITIIPDTEDYRLKLNKLLTALKGINTSLSELLSSSDNLIQQLDSGQKLLQND